MDLELYLKTVFKNLTVKIEKKDFNKLMNYLKENNYMFASSEIDMKSEMPIYKVYLKDNNTGKEATLVIKSRYERYIIEGDNLIDFSTKEDQESKTKKLK